MGPIAQSDGHDAPGLIDEAVPVLAAVGDDIVVVLEHAVGEPVVAHELSDVHTPQAHAAHQARDGAPRQVMAFAFQLAPELAHAIDAEVLLEHACDLGHQRGIALCPIRQLRWIATTGCLRAIGGRGDRQNLQSGPTTCPPR
jgi:hypothetical protein